MADVPIFLDGMSLLGAFTFSLFHETGSYAHNSVQRDTHGSVAKGTKPSPVAGGRTENWRMTLLSISKVDEARPDSSLSVVSKSKEVGVQTMAFPHH